MRSVVVADASVIVKWLLPERDEERDTETALSLLAAYRDGAVALREPPHWLAEVTAVLTRLSPATVQADVADLHAMGVEVQDGLAVYRRAAALATALDLHVFDTLYHAVALETPGATLVTADVKYFRKAAAKGSIVVLSRWRQLPAGGSSA